MAGDGNIQSAQVGQIVQQEEKQGDGLTGAGGR